MIQTSPLRAGELARLTGVTPDTLRHYERMKVLAVPQRSSGNYRLYPPEAVARVQLIRRAQAVGFSLAELAKVLRVRDEGGTPCRQAKGMLEQKLTQLDEQLTDLLAMRDHLRLVLKDWNERLTRTPNGKPARLLETLAAPARHVRRASPLKGTPK